MKREIIPQESNRAEAFRLWMSSPMPMVTLVKTLDVSRLVKVGKKSGMKFTTLMCWCIGKAASQIEEFYTLPENGKLFQYDRLAINVIVNNKDGGINSCDIPFTDDPQQFNRDYLELTTKAVKECKSSFLEDCMVVGTSATWAKAWVAEFFCSFADSIFKKPERRKHVKTSHQPSARIPHAGRRGS